MVYKCFEDMFICINNVLVLPLSSELRAVNIRLLTGHEGESS